MVMSDSIGTDACSFQEVQARGQPGSLNKSARRVNHVAQIREKKEGSDADLCLIRKGADGRKTDIMSGCRTVSCLQTFILSLWP